MPVVLKCLLAQPAQVAIKMPAMFLLAMGISAQSRLGSLRISFDDRIDPAALDRFYSCLSKLSENLMLVA